MKKNKFENIAFLGLGSNKGESSKYLQSAITQLNSNDKICIENISSFYETSPMGIESQQNFINAVVKISTNLSPHELHIIIKNIEDVIGRKKTFRWGPREIDIDLLFYNETVIIEENLKIPHMGITERDFVLIPLLEIEPEKKLPIENIPLKYFAEKLSNHYILKKFSNNIVIEE